MRVFLALMLAGCSMPAQDQVGNFYPLVCQEPLTAMWQEASYPVVIDEDRPGYLAGLTFGGTIFISPKLRGWRYDDAVRHELCHAVVGDWHG